MTDVSFSTSVPLVRFPHFYGTVRDMRAAGAYLRVAIVNGCRSYHRKRRTEREHLPALVEPDNGAAPAAELDDILGALPDRQRDVVRMRYWDMCPEAEIATALGCKPGTVKSLASRAKHHLAAQLS